MSYEVIETSIGVVSGRKFPSESGQFFGLAEVAGYQEGVFLAGRCWVFDHKCKKQCQVPGTVRPRHVAVANTGTIIVGDSLEFSDDAKCRAIVSSRGGKILFELLLDRNCVAVAISESGRFAVLATANPDNALRIIDTPAGEIVHVFEGRGFADIARVFDNGGGLVTGNGEELSW